MGGLSRGFSSVGKNWRTFVLFKSLRRAKRRVPALFLHIQKTAGTSIVSLAREHYRGDYISHGDWVGADAQSFQNVGFVSGHFGYEYAKDLMKDRFSFTFLREPVDRVLSLYYFCKSRDPEQFPIYRIAQKHSLEEFLELGFSNEIVMAHIRNNQAWQLAYGFGNSGLTLQEFDADELLGLAKAHLHEFSYVGELDSNYSRDVERIQRALKMPASVVKKENVTKKRKVSSELSSRSVELLHELTRLDQGLLEYAREKIKRE